MRSGALLAAALALTACGGRIAAEPVSVSGDDAAAAAGGDASTRGLDDAAVAGDVTTFFDGGNETGNLFGDGCNVPTISVSECQPDDACCKIDVSWTCGSTSYQLGGSCMSTPGASGSAWNYACTEDGHSTSNATVLSTEPCPCFDASALFAFAQAHCGS